MKTYKKADLETMEAKAAISEAMGMWRERCAKTYATKGDYGSCVLGAGIVVSFTPPRCRYPRRHTIIAATDVTHCQGSCVWEESVRDVIAFLATKGIEAEYECGNMD